MPGGMENYMPPQVPDVNTQGPGDPTKPAPKVKGGGMEDNFVYKEPASNLNFGRNTEVNLDAYRKYMPGGVNSDFDIDLERAQNQGKLETLGKTMSNLIPNIATGIVETVGYAGALLTEWGDDRDYSNALTREMQKWHNPFGDIYKEHPNQTWDIGDSAWWSDAFSQTVESGAAFALPGGEIAKAFEWAAEAATAARAGKVVSGAIKGIARVASASTMGYLEGAMSGYRIYDQAYKTQLRKNLDAGDDPVEADKKAKHVASDAASTTVQMYTKLGAILNLTAFSPIFKKVDDEAQQWLSTVGKRGAIDALETKAAWRSRVAAAGFGDKDIARIFAPRSGISSIGSEITQEGSEEFIQNYFDKTGEDIGNDRKVPDGIAAVQDFVDKTVDSEGALSFVLGGLGGGLQTVILDNIPLHRVAKYGADNKAIMKTDAAGIVTDKNGVPKFETHLVSSRTREMDHHKKIFEDARNAIVSDIDWFSKKNDEMMAEKDPVRREELRGQMMDVGNLNAVESGLSKNWKQQYQEVHDIDNEHSLGEKMQPQIDQVNEQLKAATDAGEDVTALVKQRQDLLTQQASLKDTSEAMQKGYAKSMDDNEYKAQAKEAIADLEHYQKTWDQTQKLYGHSDEQKNANLADFIFSHQIDLHRNQKILRTNEDEHAKNSTEYDTQHAGIDEFDLLVQKYHNENEEGALERAVHEADYNNADKPEVQAKYYGGDAKAIRSLLKQKIQDIDERSKRNDDGMKMSFDQSDWAKRNPGKGYKEYNEAIAAMSVSHAQISQHKVQIELHRTRIQALNNKLNEILTSKGIMNTIKVAMSQKRDLIKEMEDRNKKDNTEALLRQKSGEAARSLNKTQLGVQERTAREQILKLETEIAELTTRLHTEEAERERIKKGTSLWKQFTKSTDLDALKEKIRVTGYDLKRKQFELKTAVDQLDAILAASAVSTATGTVVIPVVTPVVTPAPPVVTPVPPVVTAPVITAPVVTPTPTPPVVTAPVVTTPVVTAPVAAEIDYDNIEWKDFAKAVPLLGGDHITSKDELDKKVAWLKQAVIDLRADGNDIAADEKQTALDQVEAFLKTQMKSAAPIVTAPDPVEIPDPVVTPKPDEPTPEEQAYYLALAVLPSSVVGAFERYEQGVKSGKHKFSYDDLLKDIDNFIAKGVKEKWRPKLLAAATAMQAYLGTTPVTGDVVTPDVETPEPPEIDDEDETEIMVTSIEDGIAEAPDVVITAEDMPVEVPPDSPETSVTTDGEAAKLHKGKKATSGATVMNSTLIFIDYDDRDGNHRKISPDGKMNSYTPDEVLDPTKLKAGEELHIRISQYKGESNDDTEPNTLKTLDYNDFFDENKRVKQTDEHIGNVPIVILNGEGHVVGYLATQTRLSARYPDSANFMHVADDYQQQAIKENMELRRSVVAAQGQDSYIKIDEKGPGTVIENYELISDRKVEGKPNRQTYRRKRVSAKKSLPDDSLVMVIVKDGSANENKKDPTRKDLTSDTQDLKGMNNVPSVLLPMANGQHAVSPLFMPALYEKGGDETAINSVMRVIELFIAQDPKNADEINKLLGVTGFDVGTVEGARGFINQFFTYTQGFEEADTIADPAVVKNSRQKFMFNIAEVPGKHGIVMLGTTMNATKPMVATMKNLDQFRQALMDGFAGDGNIMPTRYRNVVYSDPDINRKGINEPGDFTEMSFMGGKWNTTVHEGKGLVSGYNRYIKSHATTHANGTNKVADGKGGYRYVYSANPQIKLDQSSLRLPVLYSPNTSVEAAPDGAAATTAAPNTVEATDIDDDMAESLGYTVGYQQTVAIDTVVQPATSLTPLSLSAMENKHNLLEPGERTDTTPQEAHDALKDAGIPFIAEGHDPFIQCK